MTATCCCGSGETQSVLGSVRLITNIMSPLPSISLLLNIANNKREVRAV